MRQTLLRIRLDALFSLEPIDGLTTIGIGWLLIPWALVGLWWWSTRKRPVAWTADALFTAGLWAAAGIGVLSAPLFASAGQFVPVYGYGFMLFVGFLTGGWWAARRAKSAGLPEEIVWDVALWIFFGGILGARLFYLIQYRDRVFAGLSPGEMLRAAVNLPDGGLVLYGGIVLGSVAFLLFSRQRKVPPLLLADIVVPSFFVGLGFGRIGCFLNGCCYGHVCSLPWAVAFPGPSPSQPSGSVPFHALVERGLLSPEATASLALHPTQIYSAINAFVLAFLLHAYFRYRPRNGMVLALALICYPLTRFVLEILRADESGQFGTEFTISQWVSIGIVTGGVALAAWLSTRPRPDSPAAARAGAVT